MDVKEAIATAKSYVEEVYAGSEPVSDVSLEEVEFDPTKAQWLITIEFSRPLKSGLRSRARELLESMSGEEITPRRRVQKIVLVSDLHRTAVGMKNREAA